MPAYRSPGRPRWPAAAERAERLLLRAAVLFLLALVVGQVLLATDARTLISYVYRLEGVAYDPRALGEPEAVGALYLGPAGEPVRTVTLALVDRPAAPGLRVLLNGYAVADFSRPSVTVVVYPGDELALDGRAEPEAVRVRVVDAAELVAPAEGIEVEVRGDLRSLGRVLPR